MIPWLVGQLNKFTGWALKVDPIGDSFKDQTKDSRQLHEVSMIFRAIPWRYHPLLFEDKFIKICTDDRVIGEALTQLAQVNEAIPSVMDFAHNAQDMHYVLVHYDQGFTLYWFHHCQANAQTAIDDKGFILYQFKNFMAMPFNFLAYSQRFKLPQASLPLLYNQVNGQLRELIQQLDLSVGYRGILSPDFVGFQLDSMD